MVSGENFISAMNRAHELENLARMYYLAIVAGRPAILSDDEVMRTVERFKTYGGRVGAAVVPPVPGKRARGKAKATTRKKSTAAKPRA